MLKTVSLDTLHDIDVLLRIKQMTHGALLVEQGALYPALYRLEHQGLLDGEWGTSDNNRRAKFYTLTAAGRKRLKAETESWNRTAAAMTSALKTRPSEDDGDARQAAVTAHTRRASDLRGRDG
jgi:transcriptional regulator